MLEVHINRVRTYASRQCQLSHTSNIQPWLLLLLPFQHQFKPPLHRAMYSFTKLFVCCSVAGAASADYVQGIYDLVKRRMPQHADSFQFSLLDTVQNQSYHKNQVTDQYIVSTLQNGTVLVEGNSLSALTYGYVYTPVPKLH